MLVSDERKVLSYVDGRKMKKLLKLKIRTTCYNCNYVNFLNFIKNNYRPFINDFISFIREKDYRFRTKPLTKVL